MRRRSECPVQGCDHPCKASNFAQKIAEPVIRTAISNLTITEKSITTRWLSHGFSSSSTSPEGEGSVRSTQSARPVQEEFKPMSCCSFGWSQVTDAFELASQRTTVSAWARRRLLSLSSRVRKSLFPALRACDLQPEEHESSFSSSSTHHLYLLHPVFIFNA